MVAFQLATAARAGCRHGGAAWHRGSVAGASPRVYRSLWLKRLHIGVFHEDDACRLRMKPIRQPVDVHASAPVRSARAGLRRAAPPGTGSP